MIIGEPGIGKTAIVEGLASKIADGVVPSSLKNKIVYSLDLSSVVAGAKIKGEFEQRIKDIIEYVTTHDEVILFIDEIHNLVTGAKSDGVDASEILKPALARGEIRVIGATTIAEYRKYMEKDPALVRRFQPIYVDPPSVEASIEIIKGLRDGFEAHHGIEITDSAIEAAVTLSDRYVTDRFLPDKAIDLIDEAAARSRILADEPDKDLSAKENERRKILKEIEYYKTLGKDCTLLQSRLFKLSADIDLLNEQLDRRRFKSAPYIDGDDVAKVISEQTGIPVARLTEAQSEKLLSLESSLQSRVIGQSNAVTVVSHAIRRAMTGVKDPKKPIGVFLFVGPTGVGKTELAKAVAETVFGDENMLIRIDMSEYMESNSVAKLIGAPPGYVGYDEEGQLTEKVRRKPYSVVLFDEIEKAHRDVFNLFLQIFDDGRLTDNKGRLIDFKNAVIIMTSNLGAHEKQNPAEQFRGGGETDRIMSALRREFRPEFLNRIDDIIPFRRLSKDDCAMICRLIIEKFKARLAEREIAFVYGEDVVRLVVDDGYSPDYGARQLSRAVTDILEDAVSEKILSGEIRSGSRVKAYVTDGFLNFSIT